MDDVTELIGYGLILGFLWFVWPPLVLLGAGALLILWANTRTRSGQFGRAAGAALAAFRAARRAPEPRDLRSVA